MKNPPVPSMDGVTSAQMGRPRAVEKGSRVRKGYSCTELRPRRPPRQRGSHNSHPYDNGRGRLASVPHANWVQTRPLHPLGGQIANHGGTDRGLPDLSERVQANRARLLGKKVCFGTRGVDDRRSGYYAPVRIWHPYQTP